MQRAGYDPLKVIDEFYPRIRYLHIKDTLDDRWTEVGHGTVDFPAILTDLNQRGFSGWLTVERDEELENAFESAKISRDFLREPGNMSEKPLRVCVVGCGDLGRNIHARCWSQVPRGAGDRCCRYPGRACPPACQRIGPGTFFTDYREAIDQPQVNVVSICIPTNLHAEVAIYSAERGKHVLTEKPVALDLQEADAMIAAARENGVKFSVGLMRYHSPVLAELKGWMEDGRLGQPVIYWASDIREVRPKREMHDINANGGPVIDMAVHLFATWQELFDSPVQEVYAHGFTFAQQRPELAHISHKALDTATVSVRYLSGDVGNFLVSWGVPPGVVPPPMPEVMLTASGVLHVTFGASHQQASLQREGGDWETIAASDENMYQREILDFAQAILDDRPPLVSGEQGRAALQVALAALESIRTRSPVRINSE